MDFDDSLNHPIELTATACVRVHTAVPLAARIARTQEQIRRLKVAIERLSPGGRDDGLYAGKWRRRAERDLRAAERRLAILEQLRA